MVRDDQVAFRGNRLVDNRFRHVQAHQDLVNFRFRETDLQAGVVPLVLQPQRSKVLQRGDHLAQFHPWASS